MAEVDSRLAPPEGRDLVERALLDLELFVEACQDLTGENPPAWLAVVDWRLRGVRQAVDSVFCVATSYTSCAIKTESKPTSIVGSSASNSLHTCRHRLHLTDQQSGARRPEPLHPID
jgi:hypothetical protein